MARGYMLKSKTDSWETPDWLIDELQDEFGYFDTDPCCMPETNKAVNGIYFGGLEAPWKGRVFCNPPYSEWAKWVKKARSEIQKSYCDLIVMLLPVRTDTTAFHEYIWNGYAHRPAPHVKEVRFLKGRLKFGKAQNSAPFPSMIVVFQKSQ